MKLNAEQRRALTLIADAGNAAARTGRPDCRQGCDLDADILPVVARPSAASSTRAAISMRTFCRSSRARCPSSL
jgi:hypothetical protein